ncbi:MAG: peptidylprolyl isomerase [Elusimicrobia bacterium]|nr:peptidylprolyl isomerase [Elusimicrobiota bacterium]MBU2615053.1 peptidylprolyl isomerase [Elusimicrobiota bacterium]
MSNKRKKIHQILWVLFGMAMALAACSKGQNAIVAKVGGEKVTVKDIALRIKSVPFGYQEYLATEPGQKQFIDIMVRQKIILTLAKKNKIDKRKDLAQAIKDFKQEYANKVKQYEEDMIVETYLKEIETTLRVTDDEVNKYYNDHKKDFIQPVEIKLSHILLSSQADAEQVIQKIKNGADFEEMAKQVSLDPVTSNRGGDLGAFKPAEMLPEFAEVAKNLQVGAVTDKPVATSYGFHVLKKTSQKILPGVSADKAKDEIKKILIKDKFDRWIEEQKKDLNVKVDYTVLKALSKTK